jgi:hypothetical protein
VDEAGLPLARLLDYPHHTFVDLLAVERVSDGRIGGNVTDWTVAKTVAETLEAALTSIAIVVGAGWTYVLFVRKREQFPRASVAHAFEIVPLS